MNAKLYYHVEIAFWDIVIFALTESRFVRSLVRLIFRIMPGNTIRTAFFAAAVGLISGFFLYVVAFKFLQG